MHAKYQCYVRNFSYPFLAVFNEGRVVVAVTKMDESYRAVRNDDRITETRVKEIVSREIQRTLRLDRVSPEIVFPLCGDFALQVAACLCVNTLTSSTNNIKLLCVCVHYSWQALLELEDVLVALTRHVSLVEDQLKWLML